MSKWSITAIALCCAAIPACSSGPQLRSDSEAAAKAATDKALGPSNASADKRREPLIITVAAADRDGDGIPDSVDRCPDEPEDYDGFQDDDGCPDRDNDNDGVPDAEDRCPNTPGRPENAGCPFFDRDGDGIPDHLDKCPDEPEDYDGFEDEDGCPDLDNDRDGVPDVADKCPNTPGPAENFGCPVEYTRVVVKENRIEIKQQIRFRPASANILGEESFATLQEVAQALRDNPRVKKLRIEGHTDSVGGDAANLQLSQARADAVMEELERNGVGSSRLEAVGYGKTRPIASNTTSAGRAQNRRIEFNILEQ